VETKHHEITRRLLELNEDLRRRNAQLQTALESRIVIEQAKGILAARHDLDVDGAFDVLRRGARSHGTRLHDLAARVVAGPTTPPEVLRHLGHPDGRAGDARAS
jgi:AmiR/NasT family two-component response regulator